jgi:hypothetical protein
MREMKFETKLKNYKKIKDQIKNLNSYQRIKD